MFAADDIKSHPANFSRQLIAEYNVQRGKILTADGLVLAESVPAPEGSRYRYERRYPQGDLYGYITGFYSRIYGRSALEQSMNTYLSGEAPELAISTFSDLFLGRPKRGANIFVTIDPNLQEVARTRARRQRGRRRRDGSPDRRHPRPVLDPGVRSQPSSRAGTDAQMRKAWKRLNADADKPLLALSHQELFLPGSSFKIVTASAALENGFGPESQWPNPHRLTLPLTNEQLQNFGDDHCNGGSSQITMIEAFEESCNVTFAEIGLELGAERHVGAGAGVRTLRHAPPGAHDVRGARPSPSSFRSRTDGSRSRSTSNRTIHSWRSPRSGWTTTS